DATGHLSDGMTPSTGTAAVVNGKNITLPWFFTDKSGTPTLNGQSQALPGEFLEIGMNLTSLGFTSCFSSFLAETRASAKPNSTLSDFVVGTFPGCIVTLPNTASVSASNDPFSPHSAMATITVTPSGMAQMPTAQGSGAGTAILTDQEL